MSTTSLKESVPYEALSYTWGKSYSFRPLLVDGYELRIARRLREALEYLRYASQERVLWVDAICIHQEDGPNATRERNHQIQQMRLVYKKAARVIAWLGVEDESTHLVVQLMDYFKEQGINEEIVFSSTEDPTQFDKWSGLIDLCGREYWRRVWILQELACAASVSLRLGDTEFEWMDLASIGSLAWNNHGRMMAIPSIRRVLGISSS